MKYIAVFDVPDETTPIDDTAELVCCGKASEVYAKVKPYEGLLLNAPTIPAEVVPVTITTKERKIEGFLYNNLLLVPCMSTQTAARFGIIWEERKVGE